MNFGPEKRSLAQKKIVWPTKIKFGPEKRRFGPEKRKTVIYDDSLRIIETSAQASLEFEKKENNFCSWKIPKLKILYRILESVNKF